MDEIATAAGLCQADFAMIHRLEHGRFRLVAANKVEADYVKWLAQNPATVDRGSISGRVMVERATGSTICRLGGKNTTVQNIHWRIMVAVPAIL
jgi:hypothetical protein